MNMKGFVVSAACGLIAGTVLAAEPQYLVVDLEKPGAVTYVESLEQLPDGGLANDAYRTTRLVLRRIAAKGKGFLMGSPEWEIGHDCLADAGREGWNDGGVERRLPVRFTHDYYIGVYPVTQAQYERLTGTNPSKYRGAMRPVEQVPFASFRGTVDPKSRAVAPGSFLAKLRAHAGGLAFDLPTEAQWEFACRAGTETAFNNGTTARNGELDDSNASQVGRHWGNGGKTSVKKSEYWPADVGDDKASPSVGRHVPNAWGLYDFHGGVWEHCLDNCGANMFLPRPGEDGHAWDPVGVSGAEKALRGGSFGSAPLWCRSATRWRANMNAVNCTFGYRVCLTLDETPAEAAAPVVAAQPKLKVGYYIGRGGRGNWGLTWQLLLTHSPEIEVTWLEGADVRAGKLDEVEVLVMPGGRSAWQAESLGEEGMEKIRAWLRKGGKYFGTCAGLSLTQDVPGLLRVIPFAKRANVRRGDVLMKLEFTERAEQLTGIKAGRHIVSYYSGPLVQPTDPKNIPDSHDVEVLATFGGSIMMNAETEPFPMQGMPAYITAGYGKGRLFVTATHPEYYPSTQDIISGGFRLLTGRDVTFDFPRKPRGSLRLGYFSPGIMERIGYIPAARLDALPHVDYRPVDDEILDRGELDHLDVLVIPEGDQPLLEQYMTKKTQLRPLIERFARKGGLTISWGRSVKWLPSRNAQAYATEDEAVAAVARLAGDPDPLAHVGCRLSDVDQLVLPGAEKFGGHLQDVWFDGTNLFWSHTDTIVKTDPSATKVLAKGFAPGLHAAGCETRDGKLYVAMCDMKKWEKQGDRPPDPLVVSVYDAETLRHLEDKSLDVNDYAGSFCFLPDGSCLVGCLRAKNLGADQVRFHHFDKDFKLIQTHVVDGLKVPMGIEVIRCYGNAVYLAIYPGRTSGVKRGILVKLDAATLKEVGRLDVNGCTGIVFDGPHAWLGGVGWNQGPRAYLTRTPKFDNAPFGR